MAERVDIEVFVGEIEPDLCQYGYDFHKSGFTSSITMKCWGSKTSESFSRYPQRTLTTDFKHGHKTLYSWSQNCRALLFYCVKENWWKSRRDISVTCTGNFSKSSDPNLLMVNINVWGWMFALQSAKHQMFDDQPCCVWHPIRAILALCVHAYMRATVVPIS